MKSHSQVLKELNLLIRKTKSLEQPMGEQIVEKYGRNAFILLISCILSARARDRIVFPLVQQLFTHIKTAHDLCHMPLSALEKLLKPIGFYKIKSARIRDAACFLEHKYHGVVPHAEEDLLAIPGVGRKTAQFMLAYAFNKPALCVDTHVHRLANKFGWVQTKSPLETEKALRKIIPKRLWLKLNPALVVWGQQVCGPRGIVHTGKSLHRYCPCSHTNKM